MENRRYYPGVDGFRIAAALLVAAIHTSPLAGWSAEADFFLTRVLARTAVPFFFMVTGRFVLADYLEVASYSPESVHFGKTGRSGGFGCTGRFGRLGRYLRKILLLYAVSILLYLPVGIYAGHYAHLTVGDVCRMLVFDGTFYHLWYFPACVLGTGLVCLFVRFWKVPGAFAAAGALYLFGLFGDSYYGLAAQCPPIALIYEKGFSIWSYTRNGLFMAPVFLLLGVIMAFEEQKQRRMRRGQLALGLLCSFVLMTAEAFILRYFGLPRHDSMYFFLVPTVFFLYRLLETWRPAFDKGQPGKTRGQERLPVIRTISTGIYMLHPGMIVAVRGIAKFSGIRALVDNGIVHYVCVVFLTVAVVWPVAVFLAFWRRRRAAGENRLSGRSRAAGENRPSALQTDRTWIEISRDALAANVEFLRSRLPGDCQLMPAVKADAYGHGAAIVARELNRMGVEHFCVACIQEGIELRRAGIRGEILILGYTHPSQFGELNRYRLSQTVLDRDYAKLLGRYGTISKRKKLHVHIGIDTGMHRLGERCEHIEEICEIFEMPYLIVDGMFTHLSADDKYGECEQAFTMGQARGFAAVMDALGERGIPCPKIHLQASYGVLNYPELAGDYARVGIALYGVLGTEEDTLPWRDSLRPVLSFKTRVASVREIYAGESAGYGLDFTAEQTMRIAALAAGYADGLPRALSDGRGAVLIRGQRAPIVGKVCMDQTLVDVSGIAEVHPGDVAVVIGRSGAEEITVCEIAQQAGTITNEILSRLGARPGRMPV